MAERQKITHPQFEVSDRGFVHWTPVEDTYGHEVKVYESSAAEEPCMWLSVDGPVHLNAPAKPAAGVSHGVSPDGHASAHLNFSQVLQVYDRMSAWIARHRDEVAKIRADRYAADLATELGIPWMPEGPQDAPTP